MARGRTDNEGRFLLNGTESEVGNIDPMLSIFHDCNDGLVSHKFERSDIL